MLQCTNRTRITRVRQAFWKAILCYVWVSEPLLSLHPNLKPSRNSADLILWMELWTFEIPDAPKGALESMSKLPSFGDRFKLVKIISRLKMMSKRRQCSFFIIKKWNDCKNLHECRIVSIVCAIVTAQGSSAWLTLVWDKQSKTTNNLDSQISLAFGAIIFHKKQTFFRTHHFDIIDARKTTYENVHIHECCSVWKRKENKPVITGQNIDRGLEASNAVTRRSGGSLCYVIYLAVLVNRARALLKKWQPAIWNRVTVFQFLPRLPSQSPNHVFHVSGPEQPTD